jgi:hypothetical protein
LKLGPKRRLTGDIVIGHWRKLNPRKEVTGDQNGNWRQLQVTAFIYSLLASGN